MHALAPHTFSTPFAQAPTRPWARWGGYKQAGEGAGNLTFATIYGAGHMVRESQNIGMRLSDCCLRAGAV